MAKDLTTALVIGARSAEWAAARAARDGEATVAPGRADLPAAGGDAAAAAERAAAVRAAWDGIKGPVTLGLPSDAVFLRVVDLPAAEEAELKGMVDLQVDKLSPFAVESMVVSHEVLARRENSLTVLIAAARLSVVQDLGSQLAGADTRAGRVDAAVLGRWHSLKAGGAVPAAGRCVFVILSDGVPEVVAAEDGVPVLFRSLGETGGLGGVELAEETAREVGYTLMTLELERGGAGESAIVVCARDDETAATTAQRLRQDSACRVSTLRLDAFGSAAEGMARRTLEKAALDLTPPTWAAATRGLRFRRRMLAAAACVGGVWLLGAMGILGGLFVQEQRLNGLKREQDRWRGPAMEVRATRRRVAMIRRYMDRRHSALECLREVSSLLPAGIDLTEFNYRKGESVNLQGKAGTVEQVYGFKRNVDGSGLFLGTRLNGPTTERKTGQQVFGMDMKLPPEESAGGGEAAAGGRAAAGGGA